MRTSSLATLSHLSAALAAAAMLSSCAVTTGSVEGTTDTLKNTSDASTDFTSSTSPRDKSASADQKTLKFAQTNLERLKMDMAVGGGEHLASLGRLLRVSDSRQDEFFSLSREKFDSLFSSERTTAEELLAKLDVELAKNPQLRN